jgi:hypothetical protein
VRIVGAWLRPDAADLEITGTIGGRPVSLLVPAR